MIHQLKIDPQHFNEIIMGRKTYEVRFNDRDFRVGDYLALNELDDTRTEYTGRSVLARVTHLLSEEKYCKNNYVIMSIKLCRVIEDDYKDLYESVLWGGKR